MPAIDAASLELGRTAPRANLSHDVNPPTFWPCKRSHLDGYIKFHINEIVFKDHGGITVKSIPRWLTQGFPSCTPDALPPLPFRVSREATHHPQKGRTKTRRSEYLSLISATKSTRASEDGENESLLGTPPTTLSHFNMPQRASQHRRRREKSSTSGTPWRARWPTRSGR